MVVSLASKHDAFSEKKQLSLFDGKLQLGLNYSVQRKMGLLFSCNLCISPQ